MADTDRAITWIWGQRYGELLDQAGVCATSLLEHASPPTSDGGGTSLANFLDHPDLLGAALQLQAGQRADLRDLRVHASVLQQDLALSIIAPLVMRLFLEGKSHLPEPDRISLSALGQTLQWRFGPSDTLVGPGLFVGRTAELVNNWYPMFRQQFGVSPGAYWSSIGLALCAPFSALYDKAPPDTLCREATRWLQKFDCDARKFIDWIPARFNQHRCAIPQRRGCCLKFKLPQGGYCGTCGVYRKERLAAMDQAERKDLWKDASLE